MSFFYGPINHKKAPCDRFGPPGTHMLLLKQLKGGAATMNLDQLRQQFHNEQSSLLLFELILWKD